MTWQHVLHAAATAAAGGFSYHVGGLEGVAFLLSGMVLGFCVLFLPLLEGARDEA